jgi:uncharacterized protein YjbI with pentapeptide repeats
VESLEDDARFTEVLVEGVDLAGATLAKLDLTHGRVLDCNLSNLKARGADVARVEIERCRLTGIELTEGALQDVVFRG